MLLLHLFLFHSDFQRTDLKCQEKKKKKTKFTTIINNKVANQFNSVQSLSHVQLFVTPWTAAKHQAALSIVSMMLSNYLILCRPLLFPPSIFPSIRVFSNESVLRIRWPKYWSFSFSISSSNEYPGLISFRRLWLDLLAVQGTLKSLLQHHSSKASILCVQLSDTSTFMSIHNYWKNHSFDQTDLCQQSHVSAFNMPSRSVIAFLPRSKCLNFMAVITTYSDSGAPQNKISQCFHCFPIYLS